MADPTRLFVRQILDALKLDAVLFETHLRELEDAGYRFITGGEGPGDRQWHIRDARTDEVIDEGEGYWEDYVAALKRLDPGERWIDVDNVWASAPQLTPVDGHDLPDSLADVLTEWVECRATDDEIAQWAGVPVQEVKQARSARMFRPHDESGGRR